MLDPVPDALMLPATLKQGARLADRVASIAEVAERLLGVGRGVPGASQGQGGRAWIRQQPHGQLFITRDPADTILFPRDHRLSGQPRYRWESQADGSQRGWLVEGACEGVE